MYTNLLVATDNSDCARCAADLAISLAKLGRGRITGTHVYAARLHDTRFRQLEPGLPERYQSEETMQRLRGVHDDLIGRGLGIISDAYLDAFEAKCRAAGLVPARRTPEGRNYEELVKEVREGGYDLVAIGAHGLGRLPRSVLGSVCERVLRLVDVDVLVVRRAASLDSGPLVVAMDGSAHSYGALRVALDLSRLYHTSVSAVAAYDPNFHSVAFRSITGVLSSEAAKLFRFREQELLHDEIIDGGLIKVYRAHLQRAQEIAASEDVALGIAMLEGKPFNAIAEHVAQVRPSLLLLGRVGIHHGEGVNLGSTVENVVRLAEANVLVVNRGGEPVDDAAVASETSGEQRSLRWAPEAEKRLENIPPFARGMARRAIEDYVRQSGFDEVTLEVYEKARERFRP